MKKYILILLVGIIIFSFMGCEKKSTSFIPKDTVWAKEANYEDSNLLLLVNRDIYKPLTDNLLVYLDGELCLDSNTKENNGDIIGFNARLKDKNLHTVKVVVNGKENSSLTLRISNKKQWVIIEYFDPQVKYSVTDEIPIFD